MYLPETAQILLRFYFLHSFIMDNTAARASASVDQLAAGHIKSDSSKDEQEKLQQQILRKPAGS